MQNIDLPFEVFYNQWRSTAIAVAENTIRAADAKTARGLDRRLDLEYVKEVSVEEALLKVHETYDYENPQHASIKTYLSTVTRNQTLTKLRDEIKEIGKLAGKATPPRQKDSRVEAHIYQEVYGYNEMKEELLNKLPYYIAKLPYEDQVILHYFMNNEKDFIQPCLEKLGKEDNKRNRDNISLRKARALDKIAGLMGDLDIDYKSISETIIGKYYSE